MRIGVLGVQGAVSEHVSSFEKSLEKLGMDGQVVKIDEEEQIEGLDGLTIPGGESSTISRLIESGLRETISQEVKDGMHIMGTCAGSILLAKEGDEAVDRSDTRLLELMDMKVSRNAFGRQRYSFECELDINNIGDDFPAVFIRAPAIDECWEGCEPLATIEDVIVGAEQDNFLALSFHPELTHDLRVHIYFLKKIV